MNDNNNFPNNNKLPEGWGNSNYGDAKASPWENKPQTTAWENSPQTSPWGNTNNNSESSSSEPKEVNTENVSAAFNKFAGMAKRAGEKAASTAKKAADYAKSDEAAEKINVAKNKAQALASGGSSKLSDIEKKASDKISEHKNKVNSSDENIHMADEYDDVDNYDVSSDETAYQNNDEYAPDPIADDVTDKNEPSHTEIDNTVQYQEMPSALHQNNNTSFPYNTQNQNYQQPQSPVPPQTNTSGYIIQKQKTSPVLIIVIVVLVLVVGVLGGMFFMMNRKDNNEPVESDSFVSEESENSEKLKESGVEETTTKSEDKNIEDKEKTTTPIVTKPSVNIPCSKSEVNSYYVNIINSIDFSMPYRGFVLDLDNDGINEMIIPDTTEMNYVMYYFDDNSIKSCSFGGFMALDNFIMYMVDGESNENYVYYRDNYAYKSKQGYFSFSDMTQLNIFIDYPENNGSFIANWTIDFNGTENYAKGNESVGSFYDQPSECHNKLLSAFINYKFDIVENSKYTEIKGFYYDELIDKLSGEKKILSAYNGLENIENAPADMDFYDVNKTVKGYVKTESTGLNMRAGAGTNYNIVTEVPKEAEVEIFGENSEWYYVKYIMNIKPTPKAYFGFISKQYISSTPINTSVEVYSCNYLGQINAPSGGPINGYATSYIVDRGAVSYTRTDLMDNWHVTAVRYCVVNGITWYELYDTDDGDYYGWLDKDHIDFY